METTAPFIDLFRASAGWIGKRASGWVGFGRACLVAGWVVLGGGGLCSTAEATVSPGVSILFSWDANTEEGLAGYRVRYGEASGSYTQTQDVGVVTEVVLPGMTVGTTYYFVVSAYNSEGEEGPLSDEINFTPTLDSPSFTMEPLAAPLAGDPALTAPMATISDWNEEESGGFSFVVTAAPGQNLAVFASSDMLNWEFLGAFDNPTGRFKSIDNDAATSRTRYYQVLPQGGG